MKILGNRVLVSRIEEPKVEGFQAVEVQDIFVCKGKVEQVGDGMYEDSPFDPKAILEKTIIFAKYSPDTQEIDHEGKKYKIVAVPDILAVL